MDYEQTKNYLLFVMSAVFLQTYNGSMGMGMEKSKALTKAAREVQGIKNIVSPELEPVFDFTYWEFLESCQNRN